MRMIYQSGSALACAAAVALLASACSSGGGSGEEDAPANQAPIAAAGSDRVVVENEAVQLDGSASRDDDGTIASFRWTQTQGRPVVLVDDTSARARFTAPDVMAPEVLEFELEVTDDAGASATDRARVNIVERVVSGLDDRPANPTCVAPARPTSGGTIELSQPFPDLPVFSRPVGLLQAPDDASFWYVIEQAGRVRVFENRPDVSSFDSFVDIRARVDDGPNEAGLLGMAFHPEFGAAGSPHDDEVFLSYTAGGPLRSRISRFRLEAADPTRLDPDSEEILIELVQDFGNHNGGHIAFGPDGFLYIGLGDGGSGGDPRNRAQDTRYLLGSVLRIDVDAGAPYAIPADNPFEGNPLCDDGVGTLACPEIYAYGVRNPWRWSFDRETGALWLGDVGQNRWEEVDRIERGGNYGWRHREGAHCYSPASGCRTAGLVDPIAEYDHAQGNSITGGYVYRGTAVPDLFGSYVYGDFASGRIWGLFPDALGDLEPVELLDTNHGIASFGEAQDGELYLLDLFAGTVHRVDAGSGGGGSTVPVLLSQTGCVDPGDASLPAAGLIPYDLNAPFWSDAAVKERWLALPDGTTFSFDAEGDADLPPGSVLMKRFSLAGSPVETRLLMRHTDGSWAGYSYEWNGAGTDATLVSGGKVARVEGQDWIFPSGSDCMQCHTAAAGRSLGPEVAQLNRDLTYPSTGRTANQLSTYYAIGLLAAPLPDVPENLPALADPFGGAAVAERARSYLHTNCAQCHRPLGPTPVNFDVRYATDFEDTGLCDALPQETDLGIPDARLVYPGDASRSVLPARADRRDVFGMPPLGSAQADANGVALLELWIAGLAGCP